MKYLAWLVFSLVYTIWETNNCIIQIWAVQKHASCDDSTSTVSPAQKQSTPLWVFQLWNGFKVAHESAPLSSGLLSPRPRVWSAPRSFEVLAGRLKCLFPWIIDLKCWKKNVTRRPLRKELWQSGLSLPESQQCHSDEFPLGRAGNRWKKEMETSRFPGMCG